MDFGRMRQGDDARWENYKERLKKRWSGLQDSDLDPYRGSFDHLTRAIQLKCADSYDAVQNFVDQTWFQIYLH